MSREWKPGDVALVSVDGVEHRALRDTHGWAYDNKVGDHSHARWIGDSYSRHGEITPLRRLVVIDPEDAEQVQRLYSLYYKILPGEQLVQSLVDQIQAALREYANPTPPKPDEPQGLGAVVEDRDGRQWVRVWNRLANGRVWTQGLEVDGKSIARQWSDIDAVRVLSEGVTP